jgi:death-on-curing protein
LSVQHVLYLHEDALSNTPDEPRDLLDLGKLESALAMPQQTVGLEYVHTSMFDKAAAYSIHLVKSHAFLSGNKRVAAQAALVFLLLNGIRVSVDQKAYGELILSVVAGTAGKAELANFLANSPRS